MDNYEREEQAIEDAYESGEISAKERNKQLRDLQRAYQAEAEEAAQEAYRSELDNW